MRRALAAFVCCSLGATVASAQGPTLPDGIPADRVGGLVIMRQGGVTTVSFGGGVFPRKVKVLEAVPAAPAVAHFSLPDAFPAPVAPPFPQPAPALLRITVPDRYGLIYIDDRLVRAPGDTERLLQSPPLLPGRDYPVRLTATFQVGANLLVEDRQVVLRAGESTAVTFDGRRAVAVPLPTWPAPRLPEPRPVLPAPRERAP